VDSAENGKLARSVAKSCARRVEDLSARSESGQVFANPDGTSTLELSAEPKRVRRADGTWRAVDMTLRVEADGSVGPVASPADVRFSGGGTGPLATLVNGAKRFTMSCLRRCLSRGWPGTPRPTRMCCPVSTWWYARPSPGSPTCSS
jgi:hypothetical protein